MDLLKKERKTNEIKIMNCKESSGSNSIDNMDVLVYNDRQMDGFLKLQIWIHPLVENGLVERENSLIEI